MNFNYLRELNNLFEHRHDALILLCLSRGIAAGDGKPLHFRELARSIIDQTGTYIPESNISRSLPRLKDARLVTVYDEGTRHPAYRPTRLGEQKAALLALLLQAMEEHLSQSPSDDPDDASEHPDD